MKIVHLEDSEPDAELIHAFLRKRWPDLETCTVKTRDEFETAVAQQDFDLILSDYTMPTYDGRSALMYARTHCPEKPFIYLSGTIGEERAIEALKLGATDYLIKDRPGRLILAIECALLRVDEEKAKREADLRIRQQASLLDKAREAICVIDPQRRITFWNACAERLYGWPANKVMGRDLGEILHREDGAGRAFDAAHAAVLANGEWRGELHPVSSGGHSILVDSFWSLMTDNTGAAESIFIVEVDITEKKRMEAQLMQTQRLETLGLLAGGIAHDLNNVLAPILASVDMLSTAVTEARDRELLETVEASAQHGADLVRQLLAFARGKGGQRSEIAVGSLVTGVKRLLRHAMPRDVEVRSNVPDGLPLIQCDATQIRQVLLNLCINARDAMPNGGRIEIRAADVSVPPETQCLQGEAKPGPHVRISVADTGDGIPPHVLEKIFDPFFTTKKTGKGTGLGLVNVVEIVKSHDGFLTLDTTPGEGTTFHIHLPATDHVNGHATEAAGGGVVEAKIPLRGSQESILIIEDDDAIREILKLILESGGYHVCTAEDGAEGLKLFREQPARFGVVITDFHMPGMTGLDVVRELRTMPVQPRIIFLSGLASEMVDTPEAEGVECVGKPVSAEKLLDTVRRVIEV